VKPFGKEKLVVGERRKKATNQDTTKNRPIKFNLPRRHCSHASKRDEKEIFLETIVVSSSSPGVVHILSARALLCKKRRRDNLAA
jgi:hypothetical protein